MQLPFSNLRDSYNAAPAKFELGQKVRVLHRFNGIIEDIFEGVERHYAVACNYDCLIGGYTYSRFGVLHWKENEIEAVPNQETGV